MLKKPETSYTIFRNKNIIVLIMKFNLIKLQKLMKGEICY